MRRSPLARRTPLARSSSQLKRTRMRRVSPKQRARQDAWAEVGRQLDNQGRYACEAEIAHDCNGRREHKHHIQFRSNNGPDTLANCLPVCHACHEHIHSNPVEALARGFIRREEPNR